MISWQSIAVLVLACAACGQSIPLSGGGIPGGGGGGDDTPDAGPPLPCPVENSTFSGFESWAKYEVGDGPGQSPHTTGLRYAFLNKVPPSGSTTWPQCTTIVKQTFPDLDGGGVPNATLFAMVKQGGDYNDGGVPGWEWFELEQLYTGDYEILWGGPHAPPGCGYSPTTSINDAGVPVTTDCNACHSAGASNDYVLGTALSLSSF